MFVFKGEDPLKVVPRVEGTSLLRWVWRRQLGLSKGSLSLTPMVPRYRARKLGVGKDLALKFEWRW